MRELKGKSLFVLPTDYVVIDTETTGLDYDTCHIIEVSALKFSAGRCVDSFTTLVKPPLIECWYTVPGTDDFRCVEQYVDSFITSLTGITNEMLDCAPSPDEVFPKLLSFIGNSILVAHNANFDINFIYDATLEVCGTPIQNDFVDTLRIARKVFPELQHHRLSDIASECNVDPVSAHRAEADCLTTALCFESMRNKILATQTEAEFIKSCTYRYEKQLSSITATTNDIDVTNPIYQKVVVFTGTLASMPRKEAFQLVANLGGYPENSINTKTNYLVIGNAEFVKSVKEGKTNKMKRAESIIMKGGELSILSESSFFDLISDYL